MENFFDYLFVTLIPKWWAIVSLGMFFGIDETTKRWFPSLSKKLDVINESHRRYILIFASFITLFWAGFIAWSDERSARIRMDISAQESPFHWAMLSTEEAAELRRNLRDLPQQSISVMCTGSFCDDLAQSLRKALAPLHWNLDCCSAPLIGGGDFPPGIHIWAPNEQFKIFANAIEKATVGKIQIERADKPSTDTNEFPIQVMIGPKY